MLDQEAMMEVCAICCKYVSHARIIKSFDLVSQRGTINHA